jgi:hypothetical protein
MQRTFLQPAAIGGLTTGLLSALPVIALGNCCCCLWVVGGGLVAAYFLQQRMAGPLGLADGALVGLLAGVIGAFVYVIVSIPFTIMLQSMHRQTLEQFINGGAVPVEFRDYLARYASGAIGVAVSFIVMLIGGIIFSTIGGLVGAAVFSRQQPSAPPSSLPPPPYQPPQPPPSPSPREPGITEDREGGSGL